MALPPGPRQSALAQTASWVRRPWPFMEDCLETYGDTFTVRLVTSGPIAITTDPDAIRQIFTGPPDVLHAGAAGARVLAPLVGSSSVLVLDGPAHMRQRRLMLPAFHGARMKAYADAMASIAGREVDGWPVGEPFAVHPHMQAITLEVIMRTVFGVDDADRMAALGRQLTRVLDIGSRPRLWAILLPGRFYGPRSDLVRERAIADEMIFDEIDRRRRAGDAAERDDVMSMLLEAVDDDGVPMSDQELRDELVTLLVAGHETTATSLAWTLERLLSHREVYRRLQAEIDRELGGAPVTDAALARLPYLDATVRESLRLRPILPMVVRKLRVPMMLRGFRLPAGTIAAANIYLTHRRPQLWDDPLAFRPERFVGVKPDPYRWLPFGGGIRRCLGMAFALYEMRIVLATVLARAELALADDSSARAVRRAITFAPADGTRIVVARRRAPATATATHSVVA